MAWGDQFRSPGLCLLCWICSLSLGGWTPLPRSRRKQMESGRNKQLRQPRSPLLESCRNYDNKNKIVTSYLPGMCLTITTTPLVLWHYCSHFTDAKTSPEIVSSHAPLLSTHPHTLLKVAQSEFKPILSSSQLCLHIPVQKNSPFSFLTLGLFFVIVLGWAEGLMQSYFW